MELIPTFWYISPIASFFLWIGYYCMESSIMGGIKTFSVIMRLILIYAPLMAALSTYFALSLGGLTIPTSLSYLPLIIYGGLGIIEISLIILSIVRRPNKSLLTIVDQRIKKLEKRKGSIAA